MSLLTAAMLPRFQPITAAYRSLQTAAPALRSLCLDAALRCSAVSAHQHASLHHHRAFSSSMSSSVSGVRLCRGFASQKDKKPIPSAVKRKPLKKKVGADKERVATTQDPNAPSSANDANASPDSSSVAGSSGVNESVNYANEEPSADDNPNDSADDDPDQDDDIAYSASDSTEISEEQKQLVPAYPLQSPANHHWQFFEGAPKPSRLLVIPVEGKPPLPGFMHSLVITNKDLIEEIKKETIRHFKKASRLQQQAKAAEAAATGSSRFGAAAASVRGSRVSNVVNPAGYLQPSGSWHFNGPFFGIFLVRTPDTDETMFPNDTAAKDATATAATATGAAATSAGADAANAPKTGAPIGQSAGTAPGSASSQTPPPPPPPSSSPAGHVSTAPRSLVYDASQLHPIGVMSSYQVIHHDARGLHLVLISIRRISIDHNAKDATTADPAAVPAPPAAEPATAPTSAAADSGSGELGLPGTAPIRREPIFYLNVKHHQEKAFAAGDPALKPREFEQVKALIGAIKSNLLAIQSPANTGRRMEFRDFTAMLDTRVPGHLADYAAMATQGTPMEYYGILERIEIIPRLRYVNDLIQRERRILEMRMDIEKQVNERFNEQQEKHILKEQMKVITKRLQALGASPRSDKEGLIERFRERLQNKNLAADAKRAIEEELNKFSGLDSESFEYNMTRNYLDWLTALPWGVFHKESLEISDAERILNEDHYGLHDVKNRVLEFIAIAKMLGSMPQGKNLCFVGPPGVGKTSIGKSIARALGRQFFRFSVGGMDDVAEVKGHRRTYIGSMPGKIVQALKKTQCANPVILIDEIDKLGRGYRGDPAAALLEVLDPEQNNSFVDHYIDIPFDLSKVLFICTANTDETIPGPLKDRMEIIHVSGYVQQEKLEIARHYLIPTIRGRTGVGVERLAINDDALEELIRWYCREPGVRKLNQEIEKIFRKAALKVARTNATVEGGPAVVNANNVSEYCGKRVFSSDRLYDVTPVGVSMGLAWNTMGGTTIFIEATIADSALPAAPIKEDESKKEGKKRDRGPSSFHGDMYVTGHLGEVMKESSMIAYTVAKHQLRKIDPNSLFYAHHRIHVHVPEGATPKDGPSAGITMVSSLLSLALNRPIHSNIAMTGEISLTGKVMPIGGVKEKTLAARRAGVTEVILPKDNRKDWDELPEFIRAGINPHFVSSYDEVRAICFPDLTAAAEAEPKAEAAAQQSSEQQQTTESVNEELK